MPNSTPVHASHFLQPPCLQPLQLFYTQPLQLFCLQPLLGLAALGLHVTHDLASLAHHVSEEHERARDLLATTLLHGSHATLTRNVDGQNAIQGPRVHGVQLASGLNGLPDESAFAADANGV